MNRGSPGAGSGFRAKDRSGAILCIYRRAVDLHEADAALREDGMKSSELGSLARASWSKSRYVHKKIAGIRLARCCRFQPFIRTRRAARKGAE